MQARCAPSLAKLHKLLHADYIGGEYEFVQNCSDRPGFTQVALDIGFMGQREIPEPMHVYFVVEALGEYRFKMAEVSFDRQPGCPGESYASYDNPPSLFKKR